MLALEYNNVVKKLWINAEKYNSTIVNTPFSLHSKRSSIRKYKKAEKYNEI